MNLFKINQYIFILNNLYYEAVQLDNFRDLYRYILAFNPNFNNVHTKKTMFFFIKLMLSDGTHQADYDGKTYGHENWKEFLKIYDPIYNQMVTLINKGAENGPAELYNSLMQTDVYFRMTESWQNELCKLSKMGFHNAMNPFSENSKCKFGPYYSYQMPANRFIPDNDCGCEE